MAAYSVTNVQASISGPGGTASIGYGAGNAEEGISSAMDEDKVGTVTGADGSLMHSLHASNTGTITVRLLKTSPVNATLDAMYNFQRAHSPLRRSLTIEDIGGSALYLLSDLSSGVTGETHFVDAGYNIISMPKPEDLKGDEARDEAAE